MQITRISTAEIVNGEFIFAEDLNDEFNQLVSESNGQDARIQALESETTTINGVKTFSQPVKGVDGADPTNFTTQGYINNLVGAGAKNFQVLTTDRTLADTTHPVEGDVWYNSTSNQFMQYDGTLIQPFGVSAPKGDFIGPRPYWNNTTSIVLPAGLGCRDKTNYVDMVVASPITLAVSLTGISGLDAGTVAANTWYYPYLLKNPTNNTVGAVWSTQNEAAGGTVSLPAGYVYKRQLPFAARTNASSQLIPFVIAGGLSLSTRVLWLLDTSYYQTATATAIVTNGSTNASNVSCASLIPPISRLGEFAFSGNYATGNFLNIGLQPAGLGLTTGTLVMGGSATATGRGHCPTDASQRIDIKVAYQSGGSSYNLDCVGYTVTELY